MRLMLMNSIVMCTERLMSVRLFLDLFYYSMESF